MQPGVFVNDLIARGSYYDRVISFEDLRGVLKKEMGTKYYQPAIQLAKYL
jgi:hypothetical protein